jgi:hypothetical protein
MAIKTKQQLRDYANTNINTNGNNEITGADMNTMEIDEIDSLAHVEEVFNEFKDGVRASRSLGAGADLNTVLSAGSYYCDAGTNTPPDNPTEFFLIVGVDAIVGCNDKILQTLLTPD